MGNKEALLDAAITCLSRKGYARTTARDITAEAGTSLAAIGYHYGTVQQLLNEAVFTAQEHWCREALLRLKDDVRPGESFIKRFTDTFTRVTESLRSERELWAASVDLLSQVEHVPELKPTLMKTAALARLGLVTAFDGVDEDRVDEEQIKTEGSLYYALLAGVMLQYLLDPDTAPTPEQLARGLRHLAAQAQGDHHADDPSSKRKRSRTTRSAS